MYICKREGSLPPFLPSSSSLLTSFQCSHHEVTVAISPE